MAKALHVRIDEGPEVIDLPATPTLDRWQELVGGRVEPLDVFPNGVRCYVNETGLYSSYPNRAIFADEPMCESGLLSMMDGRPLHVGSLFAVIFGDFVLYSGDIDDEGENRLYDMPASEIAKWSAALADPDSGFMALLAVKMGVA